ncbi:zinc-binding metallopeptidase family protein [Gluconobacter wancherniae]|uniref:zinc-binding metallopeptidase family protein n=1 Tax=Gluconobacter wancherniae TaxID=1307955 RepID=UPI001B8B9769|nr:putative zinc-binding peptidase [Gluconobacter wancherniae]MBS1093417.1 putative zinc-binding peptidase [Gluconobacter wancherniae]
MQIFSCPSCGNTVFFENSHCERCGSQLGYDPGEGRMRAVRSVAEDVVQGVDRAAFRFCANAEYEVCNWLVPAHSDDVFCVACRHNRMVPDLSVPENLEKWRTLERAKHRLVYSMLRLKIPMSTRRENPLEGLAFDFLADDPAGTRVMTGHAAGLVTIALREADDVERERMRVEMGEYYRTVLGHFRHEIGHYVWNVMVRDGGYLEECRERFGDDREDYGDALERHYQNGPPADWTENFVTSYATMHPWEDFAETWAHYLHIVDTIETGWSYGISTNPQVVEGAVLSTNAAYDPTQDGPFSRLADTWFPLTSLMNSLNRGMGLADFYPFKLTPPVLRKMSFIHRLVHGRALPDEGDQGSASVTETGQ